MNVIVTGGSGFIGSNLSTKLYKNNKVIVIDNLTTGNIKNIEFLVKNKKIGFNRIDITKKNALTELFTDVDYVFHQAAIPNVGRSIKNPLKSNEANVTGTLNVLIAARNSGVKKVVYASSSSVYGDTPTLPKVEDMKPNPLSPYAVSKLTGEYYCKVFSEIYGLKTISLRYFNVFGPNQDPSSEYSAVIPRFVSALLKGERPVIYGDGEQTRDFTYVNDVVNANIKAMNSSTQGVYNISGGKQISINKILEIIQGILGTDIEPVFAEPRKGDVKNSLADISKARRDFGYEPKYTIEGGLKETIEWLKHC